MGTERQPAAADGRALDYAPASGRRGLRKKDLLPLLLLLLPGRAHPAGGPGLDDFAHFLLSRSGRGAGGG